MVDALRETLGRSASPRPRTERSPAREAEKGLCPTESERRDEPPRQPRPGADRPAGRAAALALGHARRIAAEQLSVRPFPVGERLRRGVVPRRFRRAARSLPRRAGPRFRLVQGLSVYPRDGTILDRRPANALRRLGGRAGEPGRGQRHSRPAAEAAAADRRNLRRHALRRGLGYLRNRRRATA